MTAFVPYIIAAALVATAYFTRDSVPAEYIPLLASASVLLALIVALIAIVDNLISLKVRRIIIATLFALYGFAAIYGYPGLNPQTDLMTAGAIFVGVFVLVGLNALPVGCGFLLVVFGLWTGFDFGLIGGLMVIIVAGIVFGIVGKILSKTSVGCGAPICIAISIIISSMITTHGLTFV
ncbi:hypothetical protein [Pseudaestuariivita rosea]|uniref:hypothetical protein n=1 Tax=Pseudaestuariivita rosea TaxID=2763263 RepID=UPI001ABA2D22|nr:hypothetical protein [Pseudaestuariivita rosea]